MTRARRAILAVVTGVGGTFLTLVAGIVATPFLLRWLGDERVGAFRSTIEWLGYLALLDFGITASVQAGIAQRLGKRQVVEALGEARWGMRQLARVAMLQVMVLMIFVVALPILVRGLPASYLVELQMGVLLSALAFLWLPFSICRPILDASQRGYWVNLSLTSQWAVMTALSLLFAWLGYGLVGQFGAVLAGSACFTFFICFLVSRCYPEFWTVPITEHAGASGTSRSMFLFSLLGRLSVLSDSIIIGAFVGPVDVVKFYLTQRFILLAATQVMSIGNSTWAPLTELHHRGEARVFTKRFYQINQWTAILCIALVGPLVVCNGELINNWVGSARYGGDLLTWVTVGQGLLMAIVAFWVWPLVGAGRVRAAIPVLCAGSFLNVIISVLGCLWIGAVGAAFGTFLSYLLIYFTFYPSLLSKEFSLSASRLRLAPLKAVGLFLPVIALAFWFRESVSIDSFITQPWTRLIFWLCVSATITLIYLILAFYALLEKEERMEWKARLNASVLSCRAR